MPSNPEQRTRFLVLLLGGAGLILAGAVGAMLVATGQVALNRLVPPSDVQQTADWANAIWNKATPTERELLKQIANRPAN